MWQAWLLHVSVHEAPVAPRTQPCEGTGVVVVGPVVVVVVVGMRGTGQPSGRQQHTRWFDVDVHVPEPVA